MAGLKDLKELNNRTKTITIASGVHPVYPVHPVDTDFHNKINISIYQFLMNFLHKYKKNLKFLSSFKLSIH